MSDSINATDGPVAVTGSAGTSARIWSTLIEKGYEVRACVRDASNIGNTAHLHAMNLSGPGKALHSCDMTKPVFTTMYSEIAQRCFMLQQRWVTSRVNSAKSI